MKQGFAYSLLIIVIFAFNFEAISYLLDSSKVSIEFVVDCEEEKTESEKSDEKDEKKKISEFLIYRKNNSFERLNKFTFAQMHSFLFLPSDFSKSLYMPPEHI